MPTDYRSCCRGGNATRIEPSWATRLWLWELSIWPRYCMFLLHWGTVSTLHIWIRHSAFLSDSDWHVFIAMYLHLIGPAGVTLDFEIIHAPHTHCCMRLWAIWSWLWMYFFRKRCFELWYVENNGPRAGLMPSVDIYLMETWLCLSAQSKSFGVKNMRVRIHVLVHITGVKNKVQSCMDVVTPSKGLGFI